MKTITHKNLINIIVMISSLVIWLFFAQAASGEAPITQMDFQHPAANGEWIAFVGQDGNVYIISTLSKNTVQVTNDATLLGNVSGETSIFVQYSDPDWSSNGERLAFVRYGNEGDDQNYSYSLWVYDLINNNKAKIEVEVEHREYAWSPESLSILYTPYVPNSPLSERYAQGKPTGLWQVNVLTNETFELVPPSKGYPLARPKWSPDGSKISFEEIFYIEGAGYFGYYDLATKVYTSWDSSEEERIGLYSWFPDSQSLAFDGVVYVPYLKGQIWRSDLTLSQKTPLTQAYPDRYSYYPVVSPEGSRILYTGGVAHENGEIQSLWIMGANGENAQKLLEAEAYFSYPSWSPAGDKILFSQESQIFIYDIQTRGTNLLIQGNDPSWQPKPAAEELVISGKVVNVVGQVPMPGVVISDSAGRQTVTDEVGRFSLIGTITSTLTITPTLEDYKFSPPSLTVSVSPEAGELLFTGSVEAEITEQPLEATPTRESPSVEQPVPEPTSAPDGLLANPYALAAISVGVCLLCLSGCVLIALAGVLLLRKEKR